MDQRALARAGRADDGHGLSRFRLERNILQRRSAPGWVTEGDALERHARAAAAGQTPCAAVHFQRLFQHLHHALGAGAGRLDDVDELADWIHAITNPVQVKHNHRQIAHRQCPGDHLPAADPEHQRHAQAEDKLRLGHARRPVIDGREHIGHEFIAPNPEFGDLVGLPRERLHDPHARNIFLDHGGHLRVQILHLPPAGVKLARIVGDQANRRRQGQKRRQPGEGGRST